jgi:hypothetical protein
MGRCGRVGGLVDRLEPWRLRARLRGGEFLAPCAFAVVGVERECGVLLASDVKADGSLVDSSQAST